MVITIGNKNGVVNMQNNKNNINKEIILETALRLIDENDGIKNVTLRDIAKKIGCAHTNLYNYFDSLDEIFWEALAKVLIMEMDYVPIDLKSEGDKEEKLYSCLNSLVDFSMEHPGWYKLVWLETLRGNPSPRVNEILRKPGTKLVETIIQVNNNKLSKENANLIGDILHGYLHGELCKWINNRSFLNSREETKIKILSNLKYLYKLMLHNMN